MSAQVRIFPVYQLPRQTPREADIRSQDVAPWQELRHALEVIEQRDKCDSVQRALLATFNLPQELWSERFKHERKLLLEAGFIE